MASRENPTHSMKRYSLTPSEEAEIDKKADFELNKSQASIIKLGAITNVIAGIFVILVLHSKIKISYLLIWYAILILSNACNVLWARLYEIPKVTYKELQHWLMITYFILIAICLTWGSIGVVFMTADTYYQLYIITFLQVVALGFCFGSVVDFTASLVCIISLLLPTIIFRIYVAMQSFAAGGLDTKLNLVFGINLFILGSFLIAASYIGHKLIKKFFKLSLTNVALNEQLEATNTNLEEIVKERTLKLNKANEILKYQATHGIINIAKQVAHDIRSPLAVLDMIMKDIMSIPEDERIVFRNAINRINDIANNLLTQYNKSNILNKNEILSKNAPELISGLVGSVVSEKRVQYKNTLVELVAHIDPSAYDCFVNISAPDFKRALSNLLNNAVEALEHKKNGLVQIQLTEQAGHIVISVQDNGCGIPTDLLSKIIAGEVNTQKKHGHGLGLSYAIRHTKEQWGGKFTIQSCVNKGTTIDIILPKSSTPKWFCSTLFITAKQKIIILDDDESIHYLWHKRLKEMIPDIQLIDYYHPEDILKNNQHISFKDTIFLVDYEFLGYSKTGLYIIAEANIAPYSYLVTSRDEEKEIRDYCEQTNIQIIPKNFAPYIPIHLIEDNKSYDAILIDDDSMVQMTWQIVAKKMKKKLGVYSTVDSFMLDIDQLDKSTPIYIDANLSGGVRGDIISESIYSCGFKEIYLATGYEKSQFPNLPWIKAIVDKNPPW